MRPRSRRSQVPRASSRFVSGWQDSRLAARLLMRPLPAGAFCFRLGAEPALALRRVDAGLCIGGIAGPVVEAPAVAADVALDAAVRRGRSGGVFHPLLFAPVDRKSTRLNSSH